MAGDREADSLVQHFDVAKPDYAVHAEQQGLVAAKQNDDDAMGLKSGSIESVHKTSAAASKDAQNSRDGTADRKAKQQFDDALLMALLNSGDLDNFVAENTFGGMNDNEITAVVTQIEAETGKSFEDYANDILGDETPLRGATESDADYHRRVLTAVADEVLNDDLSFSPGYENDPVARIVRRSEVYQEALDFVERTNASTPSNVEPTSEVINAVVYKANEGYATGDVLSSGLENDTLGGTSRNVQDVSTDAAPEATQDSLAGWGALAVASETLQSEYKAAAAPPIEDMGSTPSLVDDIKPVIPA